jgi:hypothetical protein
MRRSFRRMICIVAIHALSLAVDETKSSFLGTAADATFAAQTDRESWRGLYMQ